MTMLRLTAPERVKRFGGTLLALVLLATGGCATAPDPSDQDAYAEYRERNDPLEPLNRVVFGFNQAFDAMLLKPLAEFYMLLTPPPIQDGIHNALTNLQAPVVFINDLLQGESSRAGTTASRFAINSTLGVGGLGDPATGLGFPYHDEDFGQTLGVWGLGEGPYLVLPVAGPSNVRDATGIAVDSLVFNPFTWWARYNDAVNAAWWGVAGMRAIDARAQYYNELNEIEKSSLDFYAAMRSLYRQRRQAEIRNGEPAPDDLPPAEIPLLE